MIAIDGEMMRVDGQWRIKIILPKWIIDDILRDVEHSTRTIVSLVEPPISGVGYSQYGQPKMPKVLAAVAFEEENVEPK